MDNTGGPAFPVEEIRGPDGEGYRQGNDGMTLLDYFAGQALMGLIGKMPLEKSGTGETVGQWYARYSYEVARAMIAERNKDGR